MRTTPFCRFLPGLKVVLSELVIIAVSFIALSAHGQQNGSPGSGFVIEGIRPEPVAQPADPEAIPRFEEATAVATPAPPLRAQPLTGEEAGA
ncbi:MAG TPA: hypothetical protein PK529_10275, partial [Verrucomicrobiales bacterium]|nr:hypothetical protein [Verrucomicrobiales bacterium]